MPVYEADPLQPSRQPATALATARIGIAYNTTNQFAVASIGGPIDAILRYPVSATTDDATGEVDGNVLVCAGGTCTAGSYGMVLDSTGRFGDALTGALKVVKFLTGTTTVGALVLAEILEPGQPLPKVRGANTAIPAGALTLPVVAGNGADYFHGTGTNAMTGITNPTGIQDGARFVIIPDAVFTWTAAGNIALAGSAVVSKFLEFTWDATSAKWYPSYIA